MSGKPNSFDVLKEMSLRDMAIHMSDEWCRVRKVKRGTQVTIGIGGDWVAQIADGKYIVAMYLVNREQFAQLQRELSK